MKKTVKRTLSLVLCLVMLMAITVPALADSGKKYCDYDYYLCVGDSIAAGCGLARDGSATVFDQETDDYTTVYNNNYVYLGYDFSVVPEAYHAQVAEALDAELLQCARSGMRAVELRYMLEGVYNDYDEARFWGNTYFDTDQNGFSTADLDVLNAYVNYPEKIKQADVMTLNIGSNDVLSFALNMVLQEMNKDSGDSQTKAADQGGILGGIGEAFGKLVETYEKAGKLADLISVLTKTLDKASAQFEVNFDAVVKNIYALNPDITLVGVGVYNPFTYFRLSDGSKLDLSALAAPTINRINNCIKSYTTKYSNCYFADVVGTETYQMNYSDRYFWQYFGLKVHPTIAGYQYMTEQILKAMPEKPLPFTDVKADDWCYNDVKYCYNNGLMYGTDETTFSPDVAMTRGMVATVLYRINGSPDVYGLNNPFKDVSADRYCTNAVKWAYANGVVSGYDDGSFRPDELVTRQQFATMLYRYACIYGYANANDKQPLLIGYIDAGNVAPYAKNAMRWAVANKIVYGKTINTLVPGGDCTRAQCAAMLARFDRNIVNA